MSLELWVNTVWGVTLWSAAGALAVAVLGRCSAVVRRNVCRLALAGVPIVLAGVVAAHHARPSWALFVRPAERTARIEPPRAAPRVAPAPPPSPTARVEEARPAAEAAAPLAAAQPTRQAPVPAVPAAAAPPDRTVWAVHWPAVLFGGALAGAGVLAFALAWRILRLTAWRRTWRPASAPWRAATRELADRVGMKRPFSVFVARGLTQPAATGVLRPAIVLPDGPPRALGSSLRTALAHELGHLHGRDPLWYVVGRAAVALAWWCPPVWWLHRRQQIEGELAADDHALACGVRPIELARTLARFAEWNLAAAPAGVSGMACHLTRRIEMIMNAKQPHRARVDGRSRWFLGLGALLVALAICAAPLVGVARADGGEEEGGEEGRRVRREGDREGEGQRVRREEGREGEGRRREGEREREGERGGRLPRELQQMAEAVGATDAQKKALRQNLEAKEQAVRQWRRDNAGRLDKARDALRKAQQALERLMREQREVAVKADAAVMKVFTPQQRALWQTSRIAKMYTDVRGEGGPRYVLTKRQLDDIDILCEKAAKDLVAAESKPKGEAERVKRGILLNLQKRIYEGVLTDEQRPRARRPRGYREIREGEERREGERRPEGRREGDEEAKERQERPRPDRRGGEREKERPRRGGGGRGEGEG